MEEGAGAIASARRWSESEKKARLAASALFRFPPPSDPILDALVEEYQTLTGQRIRSRSQRDLVGMGYRVHGSDYIPFVAAEFAHRQTTTNLLFDVRAAQPRQRELAIRRQPPASAPDHDGPPCPLEHCLPHLIYWEAHRPRFDPRSTRRYDRHPSNPDAARYFTDGDEP